MFTLQQQVADFYKFVGDIIKIHHANPITNEEQSETERTLQEQLFSNSDEKNIKIKEMIPLLNKILYKLYSEKGVKRKLNGSLIQLFYDKQNHSYNKNDSVTQLCRHLVIDPSNLRIVSMGITKAVEYDDFKEQVPFPMVQFEEFPDGTMCVYSPELANYQAHISSGSTTSEENNDSKEEESNKKLKDYKCSTRKVLGTGFFDSPNKSFHDMFKENNTKDGLDLNKLPDKYRKNHSFVFNVQHYENRIISPVEEDQGKNTLCTVFRFKSIEDVNQQWDNVVQSLSTDEFESKMQEYYTNMVTQVNLEDFQAEMQELGLPFNIVKNITVEVAQHASNYEELEKYVNEQGYAFQGVILKNDVGVRTKFRNSQYEEVKELKGSLPIMTEQRNIPNLFKVYWRLRSNHDGSLTKFCQYFGQHKYNNIFNYFNQSVHKLTGDLHQTYLNAFALRRLAKPDIPYEFKPLCGDLHGIYQQTGKPIEFEHVANYINGCPVSMIYWRIFGLTTDKKDNTKADAEEKADNQNKDTPGEDEDPKEKETIDSGNDQNSAQPLKEVVIT